MKRVISGLVTVLIAALAATASLAAPASAASATISIGSGVIYNTCFDHPYSYNAGLAPGDYSWSLDSDLIGPDGTRVGGSIVAGSLGDPASGVDSVQICSFYLPGTYTLRTTLEYADAYDHWHTVQLAPQTFTMRDAFTRTGVKLLKTRPGRHVVAVTSSDERPNGYFRTSYAQVYLQKQTKSGGWATIKGTSTMANSNGVAVVTFRHNHASRIKVRAVTRSDSPLAGSVSPAIRFR